MADEPVVETGTPIAPTPAQRQDASVKSADDVLEEMRQRFYEAEVFEQENQKQALDDLRHAQGEGHWTDEAKEARGTSRPMLTINKLPIYIDNVLGDFLQDETSIKVAPARPGANEYVTESGVQMSASDVVDGLIRDIETESAASDVYEWGMDMLLHCGTGSWRIITEYVDDDVFDMNIRLAPIENPLAVYLDPNAVRADRLDAAWGWILYSYSDAEAKRRWPDIQGGEFDRGQLGSSWEGWWRDGSRIVAEYFRLVPKKTEIVLLSDGAVVEADKFDKTIQALAADGITEVQRRHVDRPVCEWRLVTANKVLEGPIQFPSRYIPIIQTEGRRLNIAGKKYRRGLITNGKDAARGYSYFRTTEVEVVALQPKAPWIVAAEQVEGYEAEWREANTANRPYLRYNHITGMNPPQRGIPPQPAPGLAQQAQSFDMDMQAATGVHSPMLGQSEFKDQSGEALRSVQVRGNSTVYPLRRSHARGVRKTGIILADMIPRVYTGRRVLRITRVDGENEWLDCHKTVEDADGNEVMLNDISGIKASISTRVGPAYATRRLEAVNALLTYLERDPAAAPFARDLIAKNLDIPGGAELAQRFRRTIPKEILDDKDQMEPTPPTPDQQLAMKEADADLAAAEAKKVTASATQMRETVRLIKEAREAGVDPLDLFTVADAAVTMAQEAQDGEPEQPPAPGPGMLPPGGPPV